METIKDDEFHAKEILFDNHAEMDEYHRSDKCYGSYSLFCIEITDEIIEKIKAGKLFFQDQGEYSTYIEYKRRKS